MVNGYTFCFRRPMTRKAKSALSDGFSMLRFQLDEILAFQTLAGCTSTWDHRHLRRSVPTMVACPSGRSRKGRLVRESVRDSNSSPTHRRSETMRKSWGSYRKPRFPGTSSGPLVEVWCRGSLPDGQTSHPHRFAAISLIAPEPFPVVAAAMDIGTRHGARSR